MRDKEEGVMKYFTPDLLARFRSGEIETAEWEQASEAYGDHLKSIGVEIPAKVLRAMDSMCFHDAKVLTMSADESPHLSIFLKLSGPHHPPDKYLNCATG
jgi:hypothetical protein